MKILVLNGSPKGSNSITLQTVLFLEKKFPEHSFQVLHVGQKIKSLSKDFTPALEAIDQADVLLFSYPVYTFIAPCQLHRFIRLLKDQGAKVSGKIATQISTSKHFYDTTAHRYIQDNVQEMGMRFIRGLSADMEDLTTQKGQQEAVSWFAHFLWSAENGYFEPYYPISAPTAPVPVTVPEENFEGKPGDVVIIADLKAEDTQLAGMLSRFRSKLPYQFIINQIVLAGDLGSGVTGLPLADPLLLQHYRLNSPLLQMPGNQYSRHSSADDCRSGGDITG